MEEGNCLKNILIFGSTSTLASKTAEYYAKNGANFMLVARSSEKLETLKKHLLVLGAGQIESSRFDFLNVDDIDKLVDKCWETFNQFNLAIIAQGTLTEQKKAENDSVYLLKEISINCDSVLLSMRAIANKMEQQKSGCLAVFGSVAGDRGRPSNYFYGAMKSAIEAVAEGMRARLYKSNIHLLLIKPGIIKTQMTSHINNLPEKLTSTPDVVAKDIVDAIQNSKNVLYTPSYWRYIMFVICAIPRFIFNKKNL